MTAIALDLATPAVFEPLLQPARYKGAKGGRGSGKSHFFAELVVEDAVSDPDLRIVCIREVQRSLRYSAKSLIEQKIRTLGVSSCFRIYEREIRRVGGAGVIIFEGMQDHTADTIKSLDGFGRAWVEEAQAVSKRSLDLLTPTIRAPGSELWFSWNPEQPTDAVDQLLVEHKPDEAIVVTANYTDNPFCPPELRAEARRLRRVDPDAYAHVWLGGYNTRSAAQILAGKCTIDEFTPVTEESIARAHGTDAYDSRRRLRPEYEALLWDGPYHGADFGFAQDPTTLVRCWVRERQLFVEREAYQVGLELDHTADAWRRAIPGCERYVVRADSARPESISYLARHGIPNIVGVEKWSGSVEDGIAHLRQYDRIVLHPRCVRAAEEARLYAYKIDKQSGDVLPDVVDKHNHIWDAVRYALAPLIKGANPFLIGRA